MAIQSAPCIALTWTATALGANFGGYNIYRRASRGVAQPWSMIGMITVPTGYTPANVEINHNAFNDYEAGWSVAGGQWSDGFDYAVTSVSALTGLESAYSAVTQMVKQTPDVNPWVVSNVKPYLNFPIASITKLDSGDSASRTEWRLQGRDLAVTRTTMDLPPRRWNIQVSDFSRLGEDPARLWRAAAANGGYFAVHDARGDRLIGALEAPSSLPHQEVGIWTLDSDVVETARESNNLSMGDYNLPAGLILNGTTQYITIPDNATLNPGAAGFTIFLRAKIDLLVNSRYCWSKIGAGQGWGITTGVAGLPTLELNGAGGSGIVADNVGNYAKTATIICTIATGSQQIYLNGVQTVTGSIAYTSITNAVAATVGVKSTLAAFNDLRPVQAFGMYGRILTATEISNLNKYLGILPVPGVRPPANPACFVDLRDNRTWDGTQVSTAVLDLSGNANHGALVAAPTTQGIPWNLQEIDRF
jgi:hypothetical protein